MLAILYALGMFVARCGRGLLACDCGAVTEHCWSLLDAPSSRGPLDSQVHAYEANTPKRPWHGVPNWPDHVTGDEMVAAMDKVGVDGAIFISAFSMYRYDASYAMKVQRAHPDRFAIVKPVDPDDPAVGDVIAEWKQTPGTVGIRIMLTKEPRRDRRQRLLAVLRLRDLIIGWGQHIADDLAIVRLVLDHQNALGHSGSSCRSTITGSVNAASI
jgi:predicted TIM-barrel fold metal-dependent hydrolase